MNTSKIKEDKTKSQRMKIADFLNKVDTNPKLKTQFYKLLDDFSSISAWGSSRTLGQYLQDAKLERLPCMSEDAKKIVEDNMKEGVTFSKAKLDKRLTYDHIIEGSRAYSLWKKEECSSIDLRQAVLVTKEQNTKRKFEGTKAIGSLLYSPVIMDKEIKYWETSPIRTVYKWGSLKD